MKNRFLFSILFLLPMIAIGQKKYKYQYKERLVSQQSSFTFEVEDTLLDAGISILELQILDKNEVSLPHAKVIIKSKHSFTRFYSNINGVTSINIDSDTFSITLFDFHSTPLTIDNFVLKEYTKTVIKTSLGQINASRVALIHSSRKLTNEEIKRLIEDLSNGKNDTELIQNKTCYITWEI